MVQNSLIILFTFHAFIVQVKQEPSSHNGVQDPYRSPKSPCSPCSPMTPPGTEGPPPFQIFTKKNRPEFKPIVGYEIGVLTLAIEIWKDPR